MAQPWIDPTLYASVYGAVAGGVGGTLIGIAGGLGGDQARRGEIKAWVPRVLYTLASIGSLSFIFGVAAVLAGQPKTIWVTSIVGGLILGTLPVKIVSALRHMEWAVHQTAVVRTARQRERVS
jgi:hypothetical protein